MPTTSSWCLLPLKFNTKDILIHKMFDMGMDMGIVWLVFLRIKLIISYVLPVSWSWSAELKQSRQYLVCLPSMVASLV